MELSVKKVRDVIQKLRFPFPYTAEEWIEGMYMEDYHKHSDNSNAVVIDSAESNENYAIRIKELGGKCIYSGEHGWQGDQFGVYKLSEKYGLKYRHSTEAYWVKDRHEKDSKNCHIVLVAKNAEGRKDINYILSMANIDGYYRRPRIDLELLLSVPPENLIVSSGCIAGWKYEDAEECWLKIANHFGNNFFVEIQPHNTEEQKELHRRILKFANENDLQIICGLDSHYVLDRNKIKRSFLRRDKKEEEGSGEDGWDMDYPDTKTVIQRLERQGALTEEEILTSILNTNVFVNECEDIILDRHFKIPNIYPKKTMEERVSLYKSKLNDAYKKDPIHSKEKRDGIRWEASQVIESNIVDYFLTTAKIFEVGVEEFGGILTTTSRGSSSSFVTNKLLGMTTVDRFTSEIPMYPERFITKERILAGQCADFDANIAEQQPFVQAARKLLGEHGCYPLMKRDVYKEKSAWKMYARLEGIEASISNAISKAIDSYNDKLKYADEDEKEFIRIDDYIPKEYLSIYEESKECQNILEKIGTHACGHLIMDKDIRREIGLISVKAGEGSKEKRTLVAAVEGQYLDEFGYVKEDFLIVDAVSLTYKLFKSIGEKVPAFEDLKKMVDGDRPTWDIYKNGMTVCINQCEKKSTTNKVKEFQPKNIAELSAFIAGIRPGFASLLPTFLKREEYSTGEPEIDKLLQDSSHFMIYQESIMKVLGFLDYPMDQTYGVIKAISKKKLYGEKKDKLLVQLKESWLKHFGNLDNFQKVWKVIEDAAAYSFNSCVSGDTRLSCYPSKTVFELYQTGEYENLIVGSMDGEFKVVPNEVVNISISGFKQVYEVITKSGRSVKCTLDHYFPILGGERIPLNQLRKGTPLLARREKNTIDVDPVVIVQPLKTELTYNVEMKAPFHNFLTEDGLVLSNSHSYSMAGDSLYLAWFKAHYTAKFYEVAIEHYQEKKDKKKTDALLQEALTFWGFKMVDYRFGQDNRHVNIDEETKEIIPSLSALKAFGQKDADALYEIGKEEHGSFVNVLLALNKTVVNKALITKLIKINYFKKFGRPLKLLQLQEVFEKLKGRKSFKKGEELLRGIKAEDLLPYGEETAKKIQKVEIQRFLNDYEQTVENKKTPLINTLNWEKDIMGFAKHTNKKIPQNAYFVDEIDMKDKIGFISLYNIQSGKLRDVKIWKTNYTRNPFESGDILMVNKIDHPLAREKTDEINPKTGKPIYKPIPDKHEDFLNLYQVRSRKSDVKEL